MKFWAIIFLLMFTVFISWIYRSSKTFVDFVVSTLLIIGIIWFAMARMTWIFSAFSQEINIEIQKCIGWEISDTECFGIVQDRY